VARRLDLARGELLGDPITLADGVSFDPNSNSSAFSVSATGLVTYRTGELSRNQLTWFDRKGKTLAILGPAELQTSPEISPDGRRIAVRRTVQNNADIYLFDAVLQTRFTFAPSPEQYAVWSPDGGWVAFGSNRNGVYDLFRKPSSGAGSEELLFESVQSKNLD